MRRHSEATCERGFWFLLKSLYWNSETTTKRGFRLVSAKTVCEEILGLHLTDVSHWLVKNKIVWRHSEATSERGFWLVGAKVNLNTLWVYIRARILNFTEKYWRYSETTTKRVSDWLVKKIGEEILSFHLPSERGFWINTEKIEGILRLQLSEVYDWLVKKTVVWRHSETTTKRDYCSVSEQKICEDILRLHLSEVFD